MAYDPVLDREMFRPRSRGVEELRKSEDPEVVARRERALAMIEMAKQKFDPANYQTLSEQNRPGVFRPVAVNVPAQQPTAETAMRMQQMAAQGVRPVGMARGGLSSAALLSRNPYAYDSYWAAPYERSYMLAQEGKADDRGLRPTEDSGDLPSYNEENISPTISSGTTESDEEYFDRLAKLRKRLKEVRDMPVKAETKKEKKEEKKSSFDMSGTVPPRTDSRGAVLQMTPEEIATMDAGGKGLPVMNPNEAYYSRRAPFTGELLRLPVERSRGVGPIEAYGTDAEMDRALRQQGAPDRRDYAGERDYAANVFADRTAREQAAPDKRDYAGEREERARARGITSLSDMERSIASGRDAYGAEAPLAVDQEAKPITGQMGRAGAAGQGISSIRSGEEKAAAPATGGTPATGGAQPSQGGAQPSQGGLGSFKQQGESVDSGPMTLEGIRAERAREREENMNLALIQAGLAIMGGKSSNALANIGEGAQAGIRQFATQEAESKKSMRDVMRDMRQERLTRDEMALRERLSAAQIQATSDLAAAQRASTEGMFKTTEDRLNTAMRMDWNKTQAAQDIAREELKIKQDLANNTISSAEADRQLKDAQFNRSMEFDKWKVEQGLAAPSDTMKLYESIGGGDLRKGMKIVQEASIMDTKAKAAQDILNPMSGASETEKAEALRYLSSLIKTGESTTGSRIIGVK